MPIQDLENALSSIKAETGNPYKTRADFVGEPLTESQQSLADTLKQRGGGALAGVQASQVGTQNTQSLPQQGSTLLDTPEQVQEQGIIQDKIDNTPTISEQVGERLQEGAVDIGRIQSEVQRGKIGLKEAVPEGIGSLVKTGVEAVAAPVTETIGSALEVPIQDSVAFFDNKILEKSREIAQKKADEGLITQEEVETTAQSFRDANVDALQKPFVELKTEFDRADPKTQSMIRTALSFGSVALDIFGGFESKKVGGEILETVGEQLPKATGAIETGAKRASEIVEPIKKVFTKEAVPRETLGAVENLPKIEGRLQKTSDKIVSSTNKINPSKSQEFQTRTGKTHGQWLNERGINGTVEDNIISLGDKFLNDKKMLDDGISAVSGTYKNDSIRDVVEEIVERGRAVKDPNTKKFEGFLTALDNQGLTPKQIIEAKRHFERTTKFGYMKDLNSNKVELATNLDNALREDLINIAEQNGFTEFRDLSKEIQNGRYLLEEIAKKKAGQESNNFFGFTDNILVAGSVVNPNTIAVLGTKKLLTNESVKSIAAKALNSRTVKTPSVDLKKIRTKGRQIELIKKIESKKQPTVKPEEVGITKKLAPQKVETPNKVQLPKELQSTKGVNIAPDEMVRRFKELGYTESTMKTKDVKQSRIELLDDVVEANMERLKAGETLQPVVVMNNKIFDGSHRLAAYQKMGIEDIPVITKDKPLTSKKTSDTVVRPKNLSTKKATMLEQEANKYTNGDDFYQRMSSKARDELRSKDIKGKEQVIDWFNKNAKPKEEILDSVNPTGGLYVDYNPSKRANMKLGKNMTTLDKTSKKPADTIVTIYRGSPKSQKEIVAGDFITTNRDLAKSYGENVLSKKVKMSDILDDIESPLGEEYLYRPQKRTYESPKAND